jgi:hypothetical protein
MEMIQEKARTTPVTHVCDVCVIGGSCTGVFAAVAAARLGARAAIVEALGFFGGTATASLVNVWHTHLDAAFKKRIVGGLADEVIDRLKRRKAVIDHGPTEQLQYVFSPTELTIELDRLVTESKVRPFLHARFVAPVIQDGRVDAIIIEDKSGRRAIRARQFVDASGDADLVHRMGLETERPGILQPPATCAIFQGLDKVFEQNPQVRLRKALFDPKMPKSLRPGFLWTTPLPGCKDLYMVAGPRVTGADCSDADELTRAEMEGRRQIRQLHEMIRSVFKGGEGVTLQGLPARIAIRETRHARCLHQITEMELLSGKPFPDAVANGSYRVDLYDPEVDGFVFRYLDGREEVVFADGRRETGRWRGVAKHQATYYQIPYGALVPKGAENVLVAGRCVDADAGALGAIRVMVNAGQMGQAAGIAAWLAADSDCRVADVDVKRLRKLEEKQGMIVL